MKQYNFILKNYHAIANAEINLNGITVLTGINGSGKSTISRWLYYIVSSSDLFDEFAFDAYKDAIKRMLMDYMSLRIPTQAIPFSRMVRDAIYRLNTMNYGEVEDEEPYKILTNVVSNFRQALQDMFVSNEVSDVYKSRVREELRSLMNGDGEFDIEEFVLAQNAHAELLLNEMYRKRNERSQKDYYDYLVRYLDLKDDVPTSLSFTEDVVPIWDENLGTIYGLKKAFYIDTPMVLSDHGPRTYFSEDLKDTLIKKSDHVMTHDEHLIALLLQRELNGDVLVEESTIGDDELHFKTSNGELDIPIDHTATGYKAFAYILRLLEIGALNEKTLLMIDEPEAHLHPQWVVVFAKVLVLLNQLLHVRVVLASHNPDMIAAIQAIANKQGALNDVTFYHAKMNAAHTFEYINLGTNIEEIFNSFNVALARIQLYESSEN